LRAYAAYLLAQLTPGNGILKCVFFTNSGTEAVEASLKVAMMTTGRSHFVSTIGAFHGKTLGALSMTGKAQYRIPFLGALLSVHHLPLNDIEAAKSYFKGSDYNGQQIAGFIVEPVQGEGGINICTNAYLQTVRELCTKYGCCLIFDEVQTGMGRTGKFWGSEWSGVVPDIMAVGKGFGGGVMPVGACVATEKCWNKYNEDPFVMTTTFGGNPLAMAAAIATMDVIRSENLVQMSLEKGSYFLGKLKSLHLKHPHFVKEIRGIGLMIGIEFHQNSFGWEFSKGLFQRGVLVSGTLNNASVIRVEPPLTISYAQIDTCLDAMAIVLDVLEKQLTGAKL